MTPDDPRHGTSNGYDNLLCRCDRCTTARRDYMRAHRQTERGAIAVKVTARAQAIAVKLVRNETPDLWRDILDQAWIEVTGHPARPVGRPRNIAS